MVYLVDDDPDDREMVQEALVQFSYKGPVLAFCDGKMLMDQLNSDEHSDKPNVIVLDLNMPRLDGFEALAQIRMHPIYKTVPVIILTASSSRADELKCFDLGCDFYLAKPIRSEDYMKLTSIVKNIISAAGIAQ